MKRKNSTTRADLQEVSELEYAEIIQALYSILLDAVSEYLDGVDPIDCDPATFFDCSFDLELAA